MADDEKPAASGAPAPVIPEVKISPDIPVLFSDGALSQVYGPGIAKFYLGRFDADPHVLSTSKSIAVAQVIMPAEGFAAMMAFFEHRVKLMVKDGVLSQEFVDRQRAYWANFGD